MTSPSKLAREQDARQMVAVLAASIAVTILLYFIPFGRLIGRPLVLFSTYAHEMGHGLAALAVGGKFLNFQMWANGSGVAQTMTSGSDTARALVSLGGLVGPALMSALLFILATRPRWARHVLMGLGVVCGLSVLLVVRNLFGVLFVSGAAATMIATGWFGSQRVAHFGLVFLSTQLALTVFSRADYLFMPTARTAQGDMPSDVANIADALGMPFWFWGALIALLSAALLAFGCWIYYRAMRGVRSTPTVT